MKISFVTPTRMSLINLSTIGDSEKREDDSKIGKFSSGQAYSTALLLRNGVDLSVTVYGGEHYSSEEKYDENFTFFTFNKNCESTGKEKELIGINYAKAYHGNCDSTMTFSDPSETEYATIETGFALALGYNWELYMALRELWSNMLDEGGHIKEGDSEVGYGTVITLDFEEDSEFAEIWNKRHLYINEKEPLYKISDTVDVLENEEGYLRIYKQNILVYKDEKIPSRFAYNIHFGNIDERRILSNLWGVASDITYAIKNTSNEEYLREIITSDIKFEKDEFLTGNSIYGTASDLVHKIACEVYNEFGSVNTYSWLLNSIKERKDCGIGEKRIQSIGDSIYSYSNTVTVASTPQPFAEPPMEAEGEIYINPFSAEIKKYYNFNLDVEIKTAKLRGSKVIADKFEKCLIIDGSFDIEKDFGEFLIQYVDLTMEGNTIKNLGEYICNLIKK
jgi:hypothetical protein